MYVNGKNIERPKSITTNQGCADYIDTLEDALKSMLNNGKGKTCPKCGVGMISLSSKNLRVCDCGYGSEDFKLKDGEKSVLENKVGGRE